MKHFAVGMCVLGLFIMLGGGCATSPDAQLTGPEVTLRLAPERDLARQGVPFSFDPFLAPADSLHSSDEFVTVVVDLALPAAARVSISGSVQGSEGVDLARMYTKAQLRAYWLAHGRERDPDMVKRLDYLDRFYAPDLDFYAHKGRSQFYVVMIGKWSIPRPAKAMLTVSLGNGDPQQFEFDLPPLKK